MAPRAGADPVNHDADLRALERQAAPEAPVARAPSDPRWRPIPSPIPTARAFLRDRVLALSEVAPMSAPDGSGDVLRTWLVSVSEGGRWTPSNETMARVRRDFAMEEAEEDNHEPGLARKLFLVVEPGRRVACECKETERVIVRGDGYRYTRPIDAASEGGRP